MASLEAQHRYLHDPVFHHLVDSLRQLMPDHGLGVDDVTAAATLAVEIHQDRKARDMGADPTRPASTDPAYRAYIESRGLVGDPRD